MKKLISADGTVILENFIPNYCDNMVRFDEIIEHEPTGKMQYIPDLWEGFNAGEPIIENDHCLSKIHNLEQYKDFVITE